MEQALTKSLRISNIILNMHIILNAFVIFIYIFAQQFRTIVMLLLFVSCIFMIFRKRNYVFIYNITVLLFFIFAFISFFGSFISQFPEGTILYVFGLITIILNYIILISESGWIKLMVKSLIFVSLIFLIGSLIQLISPELILNLNQIHLQPEQFRSARSYIAGGVLTGFVFNPAGNGYILTILLIISFLYEFKIKKLSYKIINGAFFIFLYYLIFLTNKRGFLLFSLIILLYLIFRIFKQKYKIIVPVIFVIILFYIMLNYTEAGQELLIRTSSQDDITTGRTPAYNAMWQGFTNRPLLGNGTFSTLSMIDLFHGHNIYLQILNEQGIIGLIIFTLVLLINFIGTDRLIVNSNCIDDKMLLMFSASVQLLFILWGLTGNPIYDIYPFMVYIIGIAIFWRLRLKKSIQ